MRRLRALLAVTALLPCNVALAEAYDFFAGARYPGPVKRPEVDLYQVKQAGGGSDAKSYQRREVVWCLVAVDAEGKTRYSPLWNKGAMEMKIEPGDRRFWMTVADTSRTLQARRKELAAAIQSKLLAEQKPPSAEEEARIADVSLARPRIRRRATHHAATPPAMPDSSYAQPAAISSPPTQTSTPFSASAWF